MSESKGLVSHLAVSSCHVPKSNTPSNTYSSLFLIVFFNPHSRIFSGVRKEASPGVNTFGEVRNFWKKRCKISITPYIGHWKFYKNFPSKIATCWQGWCNWYGQNRRMCYGPVSFKIACWLCILCCGIISQFFSIRVGCLYYQCTCLIPALVCTPSPCSRSSWIESSWQEYRKSHSHSLISCNSRSRISRSGVKFPVACC